MVRWLFHAMPFAMVFAIIAIFAVKQRCGLCVSKNGVHVPRIDGPGGHEPLHSLIGSLCLLRDGQQRGYPVRRLLE
jgi:hypothetical protein